MCDDRLRPNTATGHGTRPGGEARTRGRLRRRPGRRRGRQWRVRVRWRRPSQCGGCRWTPSSGGGWRRAATAAAAASAGAAGVRWRGSLEGCWGRERAAQSQPFLAPGDGAAWDGGAEGCFPKPCLTGTQKVVGWLGSAHALGGHSVHAALAVCGGGVAQHGR